MDGILLIDKQAGEDVARRRRRGAPRARHQRVGHAGTLDPFATGLLLVLVGRATRIQRFLMALPKTYVATARLGAVSTTGDPEGEITVTGSIPPDPLHLPTGELRQRPPAYSAVHVDGERAYATRPARRGRRDARAHRARAALRAALAPGGPGASSRSSARSGTYVRSLVADLGDAYCEALRRTAIGPFDVRDADPGRVVGLADALRFMPVGGAWTRTTRAPRCTAARCPIPGRHEGPVLLLDAGGPVAVAEPRDGALKPTVGFRA